MQISVKPSSKVKCLLRDRFSHRKGGIGVNSLIYGCFGVTGRELGATSHGFKGTSVLVCYARRQDTMKKIRFVMYIRGSHCVCFIRHCGVA